MIERDPRLGWVLVRLLAAAPAIGLAACQSGTDPDGTAPDLQSPVVRLAGSVPALSQGTVCGEAAGPTILEASAGQEIRVDLELEDDRQLAQYKVDIHHNFDCHGHQKRVAAGGPWSLVAIREASGTRLTRTEVFQVPRDALVGPYHLMVRGLDAAGNEAPYLEINLRVRSPVDSVPPRLVLTGIPGDTSTLNRGDTLILAGRLEDDMRLEGGRVDLSYADSAGTVFTIGSLPVDSGTSSSAPFRFVYRFPSFVEPGVYRLLLEGYDSVNNPVRRVLWLRLSES